MRKQKADCPLEVWTAERETDSLQATEKLCGDLLSADGNKSYMCEFTVCKHGRGKPVSDLRAEKYKQLLVHHHNDIPETTNQFQLDPAEC